MFKINFEFTRKDGREVKDILKEKTNVAIDWLDDHKNDIASIIFASTCGIVIGKLILNNKNK